jgi:TruD family tRNA pseudouridine synthase
MLESLSMTMLTYKEFAEQNPEVCAPVSWTENNDFLVPFGITIPGKNLFPDGVVKLLPQDFIVEEIAADGTQYTIDHVPPQAATPGEGDTVYATLVKFNISTFEAVRQLVEALGCTVDQIQYAGIKDQRAITAQRISFRKVSLEAVENGTSPDFFLKDIASGKGVLQPGMLSGNRFTILVRTKPTINEPDAIARLASSLKSVVENGFYNFFYLQRFSSPRYINFRWGRDILLGNYEAVVRSILIDVTPTETLFFAQVRSQLATRWGDWEATQAYVEATVPMDVFQTERMALAYLIANPNDFLGVLKQDTRQTQLWVYAFGSKLFNEQLSFFAKKGNVPTELPTILSPSRDDTAIFRHLFEVEGVWPPTWPSLRDFPHIQRRRQTVQTTIPVVFEKVDVVPAGIVLQFTLQKGGYATTFLSHLFNLRGGTLPAGEGEFSLEDSAVMPQTTRDYFAPVMEAVNIGETADEA